MRVVQEPYVCLGCSYRFKQLLFRSKSVVCPIVIDVAESARAVQAVHSDALMAGHVQLRGAYKWLESKTLRVESRLEAVHPALYILGAQINRLWLPRDVNEFQRAHRTKIRPFGSLILHCKEGDKQYNNENTHLLASVGGHCERIVAVWSAGASQCKRRLRFVIDVSRTDTGAVSIRG
jgi:hypothetical protein